MDFRRKSAAASLVQVSTAVAVCLMQISSVQADDAVECRKSYVSDFCAGTMLVAVGQATNAGRTEIASSLTKQYKDFSIAYKSSIEFDSNTKKQIVKDAFDKYSLQTVGGCIGKDKKGAQALVELAYHFCKKR